MAPEPQFPKPETIDRTPGAVDALDRTTRLLVGLALVAAGVIVIWQQGIVRDAEASVAGHWFGVVLNGRILVASDVMYFPWAKGPLIGLQITQECTVALLAGPLLILGGGLLGLTSVRWLRLWAGLLLGLTMVMAVNQLRIALIAASTQHWGMHGYDISHKFVGSVIAIAGFAAAARMMVKLSVKPSLGDRGRGVSSGTVHER